jgi:hypothetical protein
LIASFFFFMRWMRKLIASSLNHGIDGNVKVFVLMTQSRHQHAKLRLFLIGHATTPFNASCRCMVRSGLSCRRYVSQNQVVTGSYPCSRIRLRQIGKSRGTLFSVQKRFAPVLRRRRIPDKGVAYVD